jgi:hypothetical protein
MNNKYDIIKNFPDIKLSYDNNLHRKVYCDIYLSIPKGTKSFLWFTYENKNNVCYLLQLNKYNQIDNVKQYVVCFDDCLSYNTIIYGTHFILNNVNHFTCEDIMFSKGNNITDFSFSEKLESLYDIFTNHIKQIYNTKKSLLIGFPIMSSNQKTIFSSISLSYYYVNHIQFRNMNDNYPIGIINNNNQPVKECIFKIKANINDDIYELYCNNNRFYGYALINSFKLSVKMNSLFRKIKENINLDTLEESDTDEEFENTDNDKYVNLNKDVYMNCSYNKKFKKWIPIDSVKNTKLLNYNLIQMIEKNIT